MRSSQRVLLLFVGLLLGAFAGRVSSHQVGETFSLPNQPDPNRWRIISAGLSEGIGRMGVGRVSHVSNGALNLATHVFIRPDMAIPQFEGAAHAVWIELAEDSGPFWAQMGESPGRFVRFKPGGVSIGTVGQGWQDVGTTRQFRMEIEQGQLWVEAGDFRFSAGAVQPGSVEFSSVDEWARLSRLTIEGEEGQMLFQDDFRGSRVDARVLTAATVVGAAAGLSLAVLFFDFGLSRLLFGLLLASPLGLCLLPSRAGWLAAVERLYLDKTPPSSLASWVLCLSLLPLFVAAIVEIVRGTAWRLEGLKHGTLAWVLLGLFSVYSADIGDTLGWGVVGIFALSGLVLGGKRAPPQWWWVDACGWLMLSAIGAEKGMLALALWRLVSVAGLASVWLRSEPMRAVGLLLIGIFIIPLGAEGWARASVVGQAWQMDRLSGERPNEKGWEDPESTWTGKCGDSDAQQEVSVVVAGGSSVGGAYQFGGQPEAFFTAVAHHELCADLPQGVVLHTHNFGDGDRNTFTISRTIKAHLEDADILVLYVGVNDVFTTQNTLTRKQREAEQAARSAGLKGLMSWVSNSRLMVGASLWVRSKDVEATTDQVADVPLADALENHIQIIAAARARGVRVLLLTEYVRESRRHWLFNYANMQKSLQAEGVAWYDVRIPFRLIPDSEALVDRNHLSISGNQRLGKALAEQLRPWLQGSSR